MASRDHDTLTRHINNGAQSLSPGMVGPSTALTTTLATILCEPHALNLRQRLAYPCGIC